ncbi:MAG: lipid-A-disaccharide synthase N-terminal domain-containing protein [Opitutaceae bacterium]
MNTLEGFLHVLAQPMAVVGIVGQACFFSRFLVQWVVSEKQARSTIPEAFWYLSIAGAVLVLIYAIWRRDPVFTIGQSVGVVVYTRNLILIHREKKRLATSA